MNAGFFVFLRRLLDAGRTTTPPRAGERAPEPVLNSAFFIALRRMRAPLIVLIAVYAVSVLGLTLMPGVDAQGRPWRMGFFHAFYFISYTATTIGFGEIPNAFSDAQRMWVTFSIYLSVVGWAYGVATLLALLQDHGFQQALTRERFRRAVCRLGEPFYLVCGYGETGQLLCRSLDYLRVRFAVLDINPARLDELELQDYHADAPGLTADARVPDNLLLAGLRHPYCRGVVALTSDDEANLAVAIAARLLNPGADTLCRVTTHEAAANMRSFGTAHVINPFDTFGDYLTLAVRSSGSYQLLEWLTGTPGSELPPLREPPRGRWIVCGYGRFGREVVADLDREGLDVTIVEPDGDAAAGRRHVPGRGTEAQTLRQAGIADAVGLVAGTDDDVANLSIVVTARELNPKLFVVLRQNLQASAPLFGALRADFTMVPPEIIAHECLAVLTTPLLSRFIGLVRRRDDAWADAVVARLAAICGSRVPTTWTVRIDHEGAPALLRLMSGRGRSATLGALLRDPSDRTRPLACAPLMLIRRGEEIELPVEDLTLAQGDEILFAGRRAARSRLDAVLRHDATRDYVLFGRDVPGGWIWQRLAGGDRPSAG